MKEKKLKSWHSWLLFGAAMAFVFVLGVIISSLMEHRTKVASAICNNSKVEITGIEARSSIFGKNYPREYQTWIDTTETLGNDSFKGERALDVLTQRPEMVILWAGYAFPKTILLHEDTSMHWMTLSIHSVPVPP